VIPDLKVHSHQHIIVVCHRTRGAHTVPSTTALYYVRERQSLNNIPLLTVCVCVCEHVSLCKRSNTDVIFSVWSLLIKFVMCCSMAGLSINWSSMTPPGPAQIYCHLEIRQCVTPWCWLSLDHDTHRCWHSPRCGWTQWICHVCQHHSSHILDNHHHLLLILSTWQHRSWRWVDHCHQQHGGAGRFFSVVFCRLYFYCVLFFVSPYRNCFSSPTSATLSTVLPFINTGTVFHCQDRHIPGGHWSFAPWSCICSS